MTDVNKNYKAISCKNIPELFLDKLVAKTYFAKWGKLKRFILRPRRLICTVEYDSTESASRALQYAGNYNGQTFTVEYADNDVAHVQNTEEWVDPDVQAELDVMSGVQRSALPAMRKLQMFATPPEMKFSAARSPKTPALMFERVSTPPPPLLSLQQEQRTIKAVVAENAKVDAAQRNELEAILRRPAFTTEDKFRILDARDKLIRLMSSRNFDIKNVVRTKGFCPDMCPEKERYMREMQRQVAYFEGSNDAISHQWAIKQYSRSSADQEVPLEHELRDEHVLHMTMLYIMHRIVYLCDDAQTSIGDWFHFIWDRTRSIRKDITQQELCSLRAVELVEQCARFHIHCAARLVAEDPSVFDKKINAENLTKCLQSLKYMYDDLRQRNVICPCEIEFRSYIILLNLGNDNFLSELKQLPQHILHAAEIKRAAAFYNALQGNNFVRFFKMIRSPETTYLSGCILLGYIQRLRLRALVVFVKTHNWRRNVVTMPVDFITQVLAFEDKEATIDFCAYHGLRCTEENILLEHPMKPDVEYPTQRAYQLIESKRTVSVGECICGSKLSAPDIFEQHIPHNSFDENGYLKPEAFMANDQLRGAAAAEFSKRKQQEEALKPATTQQKQAEKNVKLMTDDNIFKIPSSSAQISPKQQQQLKQWTSNQTKQQTNVFGANLFQQTSASAATPFGAFGDNNAGIFKQPVRSNNKFEGNIFGSKPAATNGNAFGDNAANSIGNIFGAGSANNSKMQNIFQQQPLAVPALPLRKDNIFQHLNTLPTPWNDDAEESKRLEEEREAREAHLAAEAKRLREQEEERNRQQQRIEEENQRYEAQAQAELKRQQKHVQAEEQRKLEYMQLEEKSTQDQHKLVDAVVSDLVYAIACDELQKHQRIERSSLQQLNNLLNEIIAQNTRELAREEYATHCRQQSLLVKHVNRWKIFTAKKRLQRKLLESTPPWLSTDTRAEQVRQLKHPSHVDNLQLIKRYRHGEPCDFKKLLWCSVSNTSQVPQQVNMFETLSEQLMLQSARKGKMTQKRKFFKILITLPDNREEFSGFESICNRWLRKYVYRPSADNDALMPAVEFICGVEYDLALCVRKLTGAKPLNENGFDAAEACVGADAIICCTSGTNTATTSMRLQRLLQLTKTNNKLPVAFLVYNAYNSAIQLAADMRLEQLQQREHLGAYAFFGCGQRRDDFCFDSNLRKALCFIANESLHNCAETSELEMQPLHAWLELTLGAEMWQRWNRSANRNPVFCRLCNLPQHVVGIYNEAIEQLMAIVSAPSLRKVCKFPQELRKFVPLSIVNAPSGFECFPNDWNDAATMRRIVQFLDQLKLPSIENVLPQNCQQLEDIELGLLSYGMLCVPLDNASATEASYHAIKALIEQLNRADLQNLQVAKRFAYVNFLEIVQAMAFARINFVLQNADEDALPQAVIYNRQSLLNYQENPWWLNYKPIENINFTNLLTLKKPASPPTLDDEIAAQSKEIEKLLEQTLCKSLNETRGNAKLADSFNINLQRQLDKSIHQFELTKRRLRLDLSHVDTLSHAEEEEELQGAVGGASFSPDCKRPKIQNDMDAIMAKAQSIIQQYDKRCDQLKTLQAKHDELY